MEVRKLCYVKIALKSLQKCNKKRQLLHKPLYKVYEFYVRLVTSMLHAITVNIAVENLIMKQSVYHLSYLLVLLLNRSNINKKYMC